MVVIENLNKSFKKLDVLKSLNLTISNGGIYAILGPNGSGKTTLIKSILGMVIPDSGDIFIDKKYVIGRSDYRMNIDYLPQIADFPANLKVIELINMIKDLRKKPSRDTELIKLFGIEEVLSQKLGNLSGGTKQKVNLVLAMMFNSDLLILDEPTVGLDPVSLQSLKKLLTDEKQKGKTILISSHIMSFVEEMADEIIFLLDGNIYFKGGVEQLKIQTKSSNFEIAIARLLENHVQDS